VARNNTLPSAEEVESIAGKYVFDADLHGLNYEKS
jgi:hypothetical protein